MYKQRLHVKIRSTEMSSTEYRDVAYVQYRDVLIPFVPFVLWKSLSCDEVHFVLDKNRVGFLVLTHWNNSPRVDMSFHSDILFWFRANQSLVFLISSQIGSSQFGPSQIGPNSNRPKVKSASKWKSYRPKKIKIKKE